MSVTRDTEDAGGILIVIFVALVALGLYEWYQSISLPDWVHPDMLWARVVDTLLSGAHALPPFIGKPIISGLTRMASEGWTIVDQLPLLSPTTLTHNTSPSVPVDLAIADLGNGDISLVNNDDSLAAAESFFPAGQAQGL